MRTIGGCFGCTCASNCPAIKYQSGRYWQPKDCSIWWGNTGEGEFSILEKSDAAVFLSTVS